MAEDNVNKVVAKLKRKHQINLCKYLGRCGPKSHQTSDFSYLKSYLE